MGGAHLQCVNNHYAKFEYITHRCAPATQVQSRVSLVKFHNWIPYVN